MDKEAAPHWVHKRWARWIAHGIGWVLVWSREFAGSTSALWCNSTVQCANCC
jgi:hypothetical protein